MARTCEQRAARVRQQACREPFLACCLFAEELRKNHTRSQAGLARGEQPGEAGEQVSVPGRMKPSLNPCPPWPPAQEVLQEEDLIEEDSILVRSFFPENWLWKVESVDRSKM